MKEKSFLNRRDAWEFWPHNMSKTKQLTHRGGVAFQIRAKCPQFPKFWDRKFFMTSLCPCRIQDGGSMTLKHGMKQKMNKKMNVYVVVQFCPWFKFYSPLFLAMVIYDNEFETKEKIWTKDKILLNPTYTQVNKYMYKFHFAWQIIMCGSRKYPYPPPDGRPLEISRGRGGSRAVISEG